MQINSVSAVLPSAASSSSAPIPAKPTAAPSPQAVSTAAPVQPAAPQAASDAAASLVSQIYSTTVAGKSYSGSINQSGGQYVISIPNVPGATASASTVRAAENALTLKIDILV
jgi:hypothetical protein